MRAVREEARPLQALGQGHVWSAVPALQGAKQKPEGPMCTHGPAPLCTPLCPERMLTPKDPGGIAKVPRAFVGPTVPCLPQPHPSARTHSPSTVSQAHAPSSSESLHRPPFLTPRLQFPPLSPKHFTVQGQPFVPRALST